MVKAAAWAAAGLLGAASTTQAATIINLTDGDAGGSMTLDVAHVVQATSLATFDQTRETAYTGGNNVTWQGVDFGFANGVGPKVTANLTTTLGLTYGGTITVVPRYAPPTNTLNMGSSTDDNALETLLKIVQYGTSNTLTINGLTANQQYQIDLLVSIVGYTARGVSVSYNGSAATNFAFSNGNDIAYNISELVSADSTGKITVALGTSSGSQGAVWNAMIVTEIVPEPSTLGLLGLGVGTILTTKKRRAGQM
jgi:hypothetical protein